MSTFASRACLWTVPVLLCSVLGAFAQRPVSEKTLKYHQLLATRAEPGYLFDRFYNTWLDESTVDELEQFLSGRAAETGQTSDQLLLAFFYVKKGDDVAALEQFHAALAKNPASAATWYHKGLVEARTLDFDTAIADLKKAREQNPDDKLAVRIDKQLGKLLVRNRQTAEALEVWQSLVAAHPHDEELAEDLIELELDEGLFKEARELAVELIGRTKDPYQNVMRRLRLGDIYQRSGNRQQAVSVYTAALEDVGSGTWLEREILAQIDQLARREDDLASLKRQYIELGEKYPKRVAIHRRNAQLLLELGDQDAALAAQREVLRLTPGDRGTREEYVGMLAKVGKHDEAVSELRALCDQHARDAELRFRLAALLLEGESPADAVQAVDDYLAASDGSEYAHLRAARLLERSANKDAAARVYSAMAETFADSPSAQEAYAAFLYAQDHKTEAIDRWRLLAEKSDVNQTLHVARALAARNEHEAALELLLARRTDFEREPLYLGQLVTTAFALKRFEDAIPWALARVEAAASVADLETSIDQAANTIARAEMLEEVAGELDARTERPITLTCLLAELWEQIGDSARADKILEQPAADGNLYALSEQIRLHSQRRDWAAAADATRRILELPDGRKSLYVRRLVELYQRDFQFDEGLKWIQEWKRLSPGSTTPWLTESRMLSAMGKTDDALQALRRAVQQFDEDQDLRVRLAELYSAEEKYADAERIYWQLYEETEDLGGKLRWAQELGKLAQQQGNLEQVVQNFNERVQNNRRSIVPLLSLAEVYRQTDDYEGRRRALTAAAKIKPDDIHLLQQIARVEQQDGDWQAAVATLERAASLDKTSRTREQIAMLHLHYGESEEGFRQLLDLISGADADPRTIETTADAMAGMQEWERAAEFLRDRVHDHPADYRLRYLFAVALEEAGQTDAAIDQFLQLLNPQEELPTKKPQQAMAQPQVSSYYGMIRQLAPAATADWFELMQYRYQAYSHRQRRGMRVFLTASGPAGIQSNIQLPSNVEMVRPLAMSHAISLAATLDDDRRQEVCRLLESHGMKHADAYGAIDASSGDFTAALAEVLEKDPDDVAALAVLVLQGMNNQNHSLAEHLERAVEKFRTSRPQLALMAAIQAGVRAPAANMDDGEDEAQQNKYLDEALAIAADLIEPNPLVVMGVTSTLGGLPGRGVQTQLSETYRQKFARLMLDWYPKLSSTSWGSSAFYMVVQSLAQSEDHANYVRFLDDEVGRFQLAGGPPGRAMAAQPYYGGRNPRQSFAVPTFPPPQLASFPPNVLALFDLTGNRMSPFGIALTPPGVEVESTEQLKSLLAEVKSPTLKLLLQHRAEMFDEADAAIAEMLATKTPTVDAYLLAAGRAGEKEDFGEVVRLLGRARYLPMNQELRRQVDSSIVAAVLATTAEERKSDAELLEAGQQACLRLRRTRLDAMQRNELIAAMEELGLQKEAKKLDELAAAAPQPAAVSGYYGGSIGPTTPPDRIGRLVADGKTEAATKLLVGEVTAQVRQALASGQSLRNSSYEMRQLKQRLDSFGLFDQVLKSLDPGESRNPARVSEYAMACRMFDMNDEARKQFERVLELRPRDDAARMQWIMLVGASDPAAAAEQMGELSKSSRDTFGRMLSEELQNYESTVAERISMGDLLAKFVATIDESDIMQPYWLDYGLNNVGRQMHSNRGGTLPSLYATKRNDGGLSGREAASEDEVKRRREVHTALAEAVLAKPAFARTGFRHLLAAAEASEEQLDAFGHRAAKILADEAEAKPGNRPIGQQRVYWSNEAGAVRHREPEEFLARRAFQSDDWGQIDDELLPKLSGARLRESRERLESIAALYRCDEAGFVELAESSIRKQPQNPNAQENEALTMIVEIWVDRKLEVDLRPLLLRQLKLDANGQNHHQPPGYLIRFIEGSAAEWDRAQQLAFLEDVATVYLGPPPRRYDFVKQNYQRNRIQYGTPSGRIYVFSRLMEQLCQRGPLLFVVLEHLEQYDVPPVNNLEHRVRSAMSNVVPQGAEETLALLDSSPWLKDLDEFRPLAAVNVGGSASLAVLLQQLANATEVRDQVRDKLAARQAKEPKFGVGLVMAYISQQRQSTSGALLEYLGTQLESIRELSDDQQLDLANLTQELVRRDVLAEKSLSESAMAARDWMSGSQVDQSKTILARVTKAKRLEELGIEYHQVEQYFRNNVRGIVDKDPATAAQVVLRIGDLAREAQRRGTWHMYFGDGTSTEGYILRSILYNLDIQNWGPYCFVVETLRNKEGRGVEAPNAATHAANQAVNAAFERTPRRDDGKQPTIVDQVRAMYADCGSGIAGLPSSLLVRGFYERVDGQLDEKSCAELREWLREDATRAEYPELAADLDAVIGLIAAKKRAERERRNALGERRTLADYHERFLSIIEDETLPLTWRNYVADFLAHKERETLPLEVARATARLYADAIAAGVPIASGEHAQLTFVTQTLLDDPGSSELLAEWRERWAGRFLKGGSRQVMQQRQYENLDRMSSTDALCSTLLIYHAAGDTVRAERLLRNYDSIGDLPRTAAILARAQHPVEVARLVRAKWSTLSLEWPNEPATHYDAELAALLPDVFAQFERADHRYFAELLFASMNDDNSHGDVPSRDERMRGLAAKLKDVEFADKNLYRRALVLLSRCDATRGELADRVAEEFDAERLAAAFASQMDGPRLTHETQLTVSHLRNRLEAGDPAALAKVLKRLNAVTSRDDHQFGQRVWPILDGCCDELRRTEAAWSPEDCQVIAGELQAAIASREYTYFPDFPGFNSLLTALIVRSGELDAARTWLRSLPQNNYTQMVRQGINDEVWTLGARLTGPASDENLGERLEYVRNVLRYSIDRKWSRWDLPRTYHLQGIDNASCFESILEAKLLSADELREHGDEIVKQVNDVPFATAAWAAWLEKGGRFERAAGGWRQVVDAQAEAAKNGGEPDERQVYAVVSLARCLARSGDETAAKATLASIDVQRIPEPLRDAVKQLRQEIADESGGEPNEHGEGETGQDAAAAGDGGRSALLPRLPGIRARELLFSLPVGV